MGINKKQLLLFNKYYKYKFIFIMFTYKRYDTNGIVDLNK